MIRLLTLLAALASVSVDAASDTFMDPLGRYVVSVSVEARAIRFTPQGQRLPVFETNFPAPPDLAGSITWYQQDMLILLIPLRGRKLLGRVRLYDWARLDPIEVEAEPALLHAHPASPYLWIRNRNGTLHAMRPESGKLVKLAGIASEAGPTFFRNLGKSVLLSDPGSGSPLVYDSASLQPTHPQRPSELKASNASLPAAARIGHQVFSAKCWGCHHLRHQAFGPPFERIGRERTPAWIRAKLIDPEATARAIGHAKGVMPRIPLRDFEMESLVQLILSAGKGETSFLD